jgi:hypothetical protein
VSVAAGDGQQHGDGYYGGMRNLVIGAFFGLSVGLGLAAFSNILFWRFFISDNLVEDAMLYVDEFNAIIDRARWLPELGSAIAGMLCGAWLGWNRRPRTPRLD